MAHAYGYMYLCKYISIFPQMYIYKKEKNIVEKEQFKEKNIEEHIYYV